MEFINKELRIPGLIGNYRVMHITDSHIVKMDHRDDSVVIVDSGAHHGKILSDFGAKRYNHFVVDGIPTVDRFENLIGRICAEPDCADLIVFTGDILDFYTEVGMEFLTEQLARLPIPFLFVIGNHDSIFFPDGEEKTRERFNHLCGGNTELQKYKLGELAFIGIDNARDRYTDSGLQQLRNALEGEKYAILCQHIPLSTEGYHEAAMAAAGRDLGLGGQGVCVGDSWKAVFDMITAPNTPIKAIFCGDCHRDGMSYLGEAMQFTAPLNAEKPPVLFTIHG